MEVIHLGGILIGIVFFLCFFLLQPYIFQYVDKIVSATHLNKHPLYDLGHSIFPDLRQYFYIGDFLAISFIGIAFLAVEEADMIKVWKEIILVYSIFLLIKLAMSSMTILPDPSGMCIEKPIGRCNDLMPSGHLGLAFVVMFAVWNYTTAIWKVVVGCLLAALWFITVAARNHYTIDTIASGFIVYTLHAIYQN